MQDQREAAAYFAEVARELSEQKGEEPTLQRITERAVEIVPGCDECSVSVRRRRGQVGTAAATSELATRCDELQYELGEGPCLDAIWDSESHTVHDARNDRRWQQWGPAVADLGIRAILAIRLTSDQETMGALNLYARELHAFDSDSVDIAVVYAAHAATAMSSAQLVSGLEAALQSRHLIGVAQGILMQRYQLDMDSALEVLRRYSSHSNIKVRDVAQLVIDDRQLPGIRGGRPESAS